MSAATTMASIHETSAPILYQQTLKMYKGHYLLEIPSKQGRAKPSKARWLRLNHVFHVFHLGRLDPGSRLRYSGRMRAKKFLYSRT
jgi:hypothetical protein